MNNKVLLMILDGWGEGKKDRTNAIYMQGQPNIDKIRAKYPVSHLLTCGEAVGLPEGQMGNSEVGHLNIGAGRVVYQDLVRINKACEGGKLLDNPEIKAAYEYVKDSGKALHFFGLLSDGGVHSSMDHLFAFLDAAKEWGLKEVYIHAFMDGRDTDPRSGKGFIEKLLRHMESSTGILATIVGRYYAMDRDKRWERIKLAYDLVTEGKGGFFTDAVAAIQNSYDSGVTDEFIKPLAAVGKDGKPVGIVKENDAVIFFNFRNDRARELTTVLTQKDMPEQGMKTIPLYYCTLTPYDDKFKGLHILFDKENVPNTLGEVVSAAGRKQLRIAETEKYAHVTFFFSGGREEPFNDEKRILISSPKVATYDLKPEMSAPEVTRALVSELESAKPDLIVLNFANGDMVGHTGVYDAIRKAVETVDLCAARVTEAARKMGYTVLITADHGNADNALNPDGSPNTAHSLNPVPFIVVDDNIREVKDGILADIAPTILKIMGIPSPVEMTGTPLV
ncbi:MAG: 2,3-bisphosphoglycerate-independent phosphoglycerate mutase [Bacteroidales bacterium]|nr:2,3-bisphosphoglycerate-independent phosphoglycerate mutase [Bacteroidales bacterium]MDD3990110.1 2,3-bisphosphoglycerate-independent phosphoglycerate mutase [Bacteroidales bacterium]